MKLHKVLFEDKDFKLLKNDKEENIINGECSNWKEYILLKCLNQKPKKKK